MQRDALRRLLLMRSPSLPCATVCGVHPNGKTKFTAIGWVCIKKKLIHIVHFESMCIKLIILLIRVGV